MTTEHTGGGDPKRSIELLWGLQDRPRRGPKPRFTVAQIAQAAIDLADREGLTALSMRRVADQLGVTAMSLYTYVPSKAELLDLMLDTAYREMVRTEPADDSWRARLTAIADDNRILYERHPWLADISTGRPPLGPGVMAKYEHELRALDGLGLDDVEMDAALTFLLGFVQTCARAAADARAAEHERAMSDQQWWESNAPLLEKVFDTTKYPTAARVGAAAGEAHGAAYSPTHAYDFGLDRILDSLAVLIEARTG
ncbi:AcrR family transcriptional regulator [Micromonospora polyrhachis]|uniref:AcrR family transcriptional regulator n=1 Tax=Micromonospora polyrhachis TaxID=1282883 RepID=A0A7W7SR65_9ACTN|nr:AcrR family transcriptional regulator [Micromonospora polyrhachis]